MAKTKEEYNAYMRVYILERYHKRRTKWVENLGGVCIDCGTSEQLEFDHLDPSTKSFDVGKALSSWSEKRIADEMAKCVLRCKTHHKIKSDSELAVEHGGGLSGKKNCPCSLCKTKKAEYMQRYKTSLRS